MKQVQYRKDIDALRGLSVLLVVVYHAFPEILPGGFIGVDVFFVISGYLITSIIFLSIESNDFSLREFYSRRIRRLFPALITVLLFAFCLGWLVLFPKEYLQLGTHISKSVIFFLNFELINEAGYFDVESHYKPLLNLWTLSVEEQYYLFWPILILLFLKLKINPVFILSLIFILSLSANLYYSKNYSEIVFFHTLTRFWQLTAGSLLAVWLMKQKFSQNINNNKVMMFIGLTLIAFSAFWIDNQMIYPGFLAIIPVIGSLLIIISNTRLSQYGGLVKLGLISYPLYLWHWVIISFLYIYLGRKPETITLILAIFLSLIFAYLTKKYIEKLRYQKNVTPYLISILFVVGLLGFYTEHKKGLPDRSNMKNFIEANNQFKRTPAEDEICTNYVESILGKDKSFHYCRASKDVGKKNKKLIAIIGDSHAHVLFHGISKAALKNGHETVLFANSSCPTLKGFEWGRNKKEVNDCQKKIEEILMIIQKDRRIEKVIMTTRGPVYIHGEVEGIFTEKSVNKSLSTIRNKKKSLITPNYTNFSNGFNNTIQMLNDLPNIKKIYYILENPELDFLPKEVIPRPYDFFNISINRDTVSRTLYFKRMSKYREGISNLSFSKFSVLDPLNALCDDTKCFSKIKGRFLYADDDHFSKFGSIYIANYFQNEIYD